MGFGLASQLAPVLLKKHIIHCYHGPVNFYVAFPSDESRNSFSQFYGTDAVALVVFIFVMSCQKKNINVGEMSD